jgi:hypothetical protein
MDLEGAKTQSGPRPTWARTGALILFLLTGILLIASLSGARSAQLQQHPGMTDALHIERT